MDLSAEPNLDDDHLSAYRFVRFVENACAETASLKVPVITRLAETLRDNHALTALLDQWQKPAPGALRRCVREVMRKNCGGEPQCFAAIDAACQWLFESEGNDSFLWDMMDARDELGNDPQRSMPEAAREPRTPTGLSRYALRCTTMFACVLVRELLEDPATSRDMSVFMMDSSVEADEETAAAVAKSVGRIVRVAGC